MSNLTIINRAPTTPPLHSASSPSPLRESLSRRRRPACDERGITLQTLIVTAVLVTIAVVAAGIIVAITYAQRDDVEARGRSESGVATCEPWEIRDIGLQSRGLGGPQGYGGFYSSAVGCVRVCYAQTRDGAATRIGSTNYNRFIPPRLNNAMGNFQLLLGFSLSDVRLAPTTGENRRYATSQVVSSTEVGLIPAGAAAATARNAVRTLNAADQTPLLSVVDENQEIRVHESQKFCHVVDTANDNEEIVRSDHSFSGISRRSFAYQ